MPASVTIFSPFKPRPRVFSSLMAGRALPTCQPSAAPGRDPDPPVLGAAEIQHKSHSFLPCGAGGLRSLRPAPSKVFSPWGGPRGDFWRQLRLSSPCSSLGSACWGGGADPARRDRRWMETDGNSGRKRSVDISTMGTTTIWAAVMFCFVFKAPWWWRALQRGLEMFCRCLRGTPRIGRRSLAENREVPVQMKEGRDGAGLPVDPEARS